MARHGRAQPGCGGLHGMEVDGLQHLLNQLSLLGLVSRLVKPAGHQGTVESESLGQVSFFPKVRAPWPILDVGLTLQTQAVG
jgi:hypothetical protein